jgi:pimeloyl-ACP methyl ester carboxylesterase
VAVLLAAASAVSFGAAQAAPAVIAACRLPGVEHPAQCGHVKRPLDPAAPTGPAIEVHFAVLPALARQKRPDPVFFFAGGPGQSAIELAPQVVAMLGRIANRRDIVLVDQRGTGRSAPLYCEPDAPLRPLREMADPAAALASLGTCRQKLQALPHGDLRRYTTTIAMQDVDAVREALRAERINVVGGSYGTRAALEYQRQFPQRVRRAVIDGVAPPDMVLPAAFSADGAAALAGAFAACEREPACRARHPGLAQRWSAMLASLPREVRVPHPVSGREETLVVTRDMALSLVRLPLYVPALAAALPHAIAEGAEGRFAPLLGLASMLTMGNGERGMAWGMHLSVVCAEDLPRLEAGAGDAPSPMFGASFADLYRQMCAGWPRGEVPPAFFAMPPAAAPVLVFSGGADPVTPPRHGERAAKALGAKARHVIVPEAGHGLIGLPCLRDAVFRFVEAPTDEEALAVDTACAAKLPRPPAFLPPGASAAAAASGAAR